MALSVSFWVSQTTGPACADGRVRSFAPEILAIHQMAACDGGAPSVDRRRRRVVRRHCRALRRQLRRYQGRWLGRAKPFFARHVPRDLAARVVYPFGGADLPTLLTVFPGAREYTSISLEPSGDPRRLLAASPAGLHRSLRSLRRVLGPYFWNAHHITTRIARQAHTRLPAELGLSVVALRIAGYRPVDLRYFTINTDGTPRYVTEDQVKGAKRRRDRRRLFANMELTFRRKDGPLKVYRHVVQNLADSKLRRDPRLLAHLRAKGPVTVMVKAGSFLLALNGFSVIRKYVLESATWMVSDTTGPTPSQARVAGFEQVVFGRYDGAYLPLGRFSNEQFRQLFSSQPHRRLRFRFGYPDNSGRHHNHLIITRKPEAR